MNDRDIDRWTRAYLAGKRPNEDVGLWLQAIVVCLLLALAVAIVARMAE